MKSFYLMTTAEQSEHMYYHSLRDENGYDKFIKDLIGAGDDTDLVSYF